MTDAGAFERLANVALRYADPDCAGLVHPGVNAEGRPIPSPIDGFSLGRGRDLSVLVAHTTMASARLADKWLNPLSGDIAKAGQAAAALQLGETKLILTTNREPGPDLLVKARNACAALGLSLVVWSQSRFADFLDDDADGQWIRHRFFGEPAVRPSIGLLRSVSEAGPAGLAIFDDDAALSNRRSASNLAGLLLDGQRLLLLSGASGQGKTVAAAQIWREMVLSGAFALHLSHDDVEASTSLPDAVDRALRRRSPQLAAGSGQATLELANDQPFLLLVEDINRAARPLAALQKVILWQRQATASSLRFLCPVWPRGVTSLPEQERKAVTPYVTWLDLPDHDEARDIASAHARQQGFDPRRLNLDQIVSRLGRDPLLLGMHDYGGDAADGVRAFIERQVCRVAAAEGLACADLFDALDALAAEMLRERRLEPSWREARSWLSQTATDALRRLAADGSILRLGGDGGQEQIVFRHDRVRDQIRTTGLFRALELSDRDPDGVLAEPAYAELWGGVLADPRAPDAWIERAAILNPLGLFHGLALAAPGSARRDQMIDAAAAWLERPGSRGPRHDHLRWAAQHALIEVEDPRIMTLVSAFQEQTWMTQETACRNGDMEAALRMLMSWDPYHPTGRERRVFAHLRSRRLAEARAFIRSGLASPEATEARKIALMAFAGRLQDPELSETVSEAWRQGPRSPGFINAALWAAAFCEQALLPSILDAWASLDTEPLEHGRTPRGSVGYDLRWGLWAAGDRGVLDVLLPRVRDLADPLAHYVGNLIEGWNDPDAQEAYVRHLARTLARNRARGGGLAGYNLGELWGQDRVRGGYVMTDEPLAHLVDLWSNPGEDRDVRIVALRLWGPAARPRHLPAVRTSEALDPLGPLGAEAVCALVLLDSPDAPDALETIIASNPDKAHLVQYVRGRWREAYRPLLLRMLDWRRELKESSSRFDADHALPELMMELDDETRTGLLQEHWDHLQEEWHYVQLALWTATPGSLALAEQRLKAGDPKEILRFLSMHYNLYPSSQPPTTELRRLQALEPWLDNLDESAFRQLEEHCNRQGWRDWRRTFVDPRLAPKDHASWRSEASRQAAFNKAADEDRGRRAIHFDYERILKSVGDPAILLGEVDAWLSERRDLPALDAACEFVIEANARSEITRLEAWRGLGIPEADAVIDDAIFAVKRRTLI